MVYWNLPNISNLVPCLSESMASNALIVHNGNPPGQFLENVRSVRYCSDEGRLERAEEVTRDFGTVEDDFCVARNSLLLC